MTVLCYRIMCFCSLNLGSLAVGCWTYCTCATFVRWWKICKSRLQWLAMHACFAQNKWRRTKMTHEELGHSSKHLSFPTSFFITSLVWGKTGFYHSLLWSQSDFPKPRLVPATALNIPTSSCMSRVHAKPLMAAGGQSMAGFAFY